MLQRRSSSSCCAVHGASIGLSWAGNGPLYDSWTLTGVHIRLFWVTRRANDHGGFYFRTVIDGSESCVDEFYARPTPIHASVLAEGAICIRPTVMGR